MGEAEAGPGARGAIGSGLSAVIAQAKGPLGRGGFFLSVNQAIVSGLGFLFWVLAARSYGPEAVGEATSVIAAGSFLAIAATLGLPYALVRRLAGASDPRRLAFVVLRLAALSGLAFGVAGGLVLAALAPGLSFVVADPIALALLAAFVASFAVEAVLEQTFVAARRAELSTVMLAVFAAIRLAGPVGAPAAGSRELLAAWAGSMTLAVGLAFAVLLPRALRSISPVEGGERPHVRPLLAYAGLNHATTLLTLAGPLLLPATLLVALGGVPGAHASGVFYLTYQVASLLFVVPIALALVQFAEGARPGTDWKANERRGVRLGFTVVAPAAALLFFVAPLVLSLFGAGYSDEGTPLLRILAVAALAVVPATMLATRFRLEGRLVPPIRAAALSSAVTLVGTVALVPSLGLQGAGLAFLTGQVLAAAVLLVSPRRGPKGGEALG